MSYRTENVGYRYTEEGALVAVIAKIKQSSFKGMDGRARSIDGTINYQTNHGDELNAVGPFIRGEHPEEFEYVHSAPDGSKRLLASPPN